ncbi:hypothetical protein MYU51_001235 [Penicillium brevicompactum]
MIAWAKLLSKGALLVRPRVDHAHVSVDPPGRVMGVNSNIRLTGATISHVQTWEESRKIAAARSMVIKMRNETAILISFSVGSDLERVGLHARISPPVLSRPKIIKLKICNV